MNQKELKRLNRVELLELLIAERKRNNALEEEIRRLRDQLSSREICKEQAGTLAEAAVRINKVFEAADAAAEQYLENIRGMNHKAKENAASLLEQTRRQCEDMTAQAKKEAAEILEAANYRI